MKNCMRKSLVFSLSALAVLASCSRGPDCSTALECAKKGVALYDSTDSSSDPLMRAYVVKACELGHMKGCGLAGQFTADGTGGEPDWAEATRLTQKACDGGITDACAFTRRLSFPGIKADLREKCIKALMPKLKKCRVALPSAGAKISHREAGNICLWGTSAEVDKCTRGDPYDVDI